MTLLTRSNTVSTPTEQEFPDDTEVWRIWSVHNVQVRYMQKNVNELCYCPTHKDNNEDFTPLVKFTIAWDYDYAG